jgi:hypothetical protein
MNHGNFMNFKSKQVQTAAGVRDELTEETQDYALPPRPETQNYLDIPDNEEGPASQNDLDIPDTEDRDEYFNRYMVDRYLRCHACNNFEQETPDRVCSRCSERY